MATHAKRERLILAELLETAGPDAPTLCEGWTTRDLAAHVVVRERRPHAAAGVLIARLAPYGERVRKEFADKPYEELVRLIRTGPPSLSLFALEPVDEAANTVEFYIHGEDVRRGRPDSAPREIDPAFADTLWAHLERAARLFGRKVPVGVVLRRPDGQTVVLKRGAPVVTATGEPGELLLFASGRVEAARVEISGDETAVGQLREARLGI